MIIRKAIYLMEDDGILETSHLGKGQWEIRKICKQLKVRVHGVNEVLRPKF